jgi:hypothetical protein
MPIPSCRTLEARRKIVRDYNLNPQTHVVLLPGQIKKNLAGGILTGKYYAFEYEEKNNKNNKGAFFCGYVCGESFCNLLGIKKLPLFNPLTTPTLLPANHAANPETTKDSKGAEHPETHPMDPLNKELYTAINLHVVLHDTPAHGLHAAILQYIRKNPSRRTDTIFVEHFNNYLKTIYTYPSTLLTKCTEIPGMRKFTFPEIAKILQKKTKEENHYENTSS